MSSDVGGWRTAGLVLAASAAGAAVAVATTRLMMKSNEVVMNSTNAESQSAVARPRKARVADHEEDEEEYEPTIRPLPRRHRSHRVQQWAEPPNLMPRDPYDEYSHVPMMPPPSPEKARRRSLAPPEQDQFQALSSIAEISGPDGTAAPWQGFSMEDARIHASLAAAKQNAKTPSEVLQELQRGNTRFWAGKATRPEKSAFERRALIMQQYPSVAILGCSDSRVPIEIVFDQGLGDIFVIRVAGNRLDSTTIASLEYAVHHLKVKVLVVMGHEGCGAIKAAQASQKDIEKEPAELAHMLKETKKDLDMDRLVHIKDARAHDREAVVTNVRRQVEKVTHDEPIMEKVYEQQLIIVGAFYEISSGIVDFFHEVSEVDTSPGSSRRSDQSPPGTPQNGNMVRSRAPSLGVQNRLPTPHSPKHTSQRASGEDMPELDPLPSLDDTVKSLKIGRQPSWDDGDNPHGAHLD